MPIKEKYSNIGETATKTLSKEELEERKKKMQEAKKKQEKKRSIKGIWERLNK